MHKNFSRSYSVDALRGLAIIIMACANSAAYILVEPHPFWLRAYGSFAAPLFITLSGMMVQHAFINKKRDFLYFLGRAGLTVLIAALIDILLWNILPFTTVDVLYLIGISIPVVYLLRNIRFWLRCLLAIVIFLATPVLQEKLGYTDYPTEFTLSGTISIPSANPTGILNHWLVDGWFPVFPWLGFSMLGSVLADIKNGNCKIDFFSIKFLLIGIVLSVAGMIIWNIFPVPQITREGYSELFYPPGISYCLCAAGIVFLLFFLITRLRIIAEFKPFRYLGECSLLMYILHLIIISVILQPMLGLNETKIFLAVYLLFIMGLIGIATALHYLKKKIKKMPYLLRFLLGG